MHWCVLAQVAVGLKAHKPFKAKLFSKSETTSTRVMSSTTSPNRLVFAQTQVYSSRLLGKKVSVKCKTHLSLLIMLSSDYKFYRYC